MVELLSPGGNLEKIKFAVSYGADAVYCALKRFGLRSKAGNLTEEEYIDALDMVHDRERKLYLTLNAYLVDKDFEELFRIIDFINNHKPDAVIVSDPGVIFAISKYTDIPIHISTQANITNSYAANLFKPFNIKRVVLARELTLRDIKLFRQGTNLELEAFIHGAMCMAYSGRCFISSYLTGRSANRGDCAQSCRWRYTIFEQKRPDMPLTLEEHEDGSFIFNSYDLCALPILPEILGSGITSLKIEGRMKSIYYVAVTTEVYRDAIDTILKGGNFNTKIDYYMKELEKVSHRPYSLGFYLGSPKQYTESSGFVRSCKFCGVLMDYSNGIAKFQVRDRVEPGYYEIIQPNFKRRKIYVKSFMDGNMNEKIYGNPNEFVYIRIPEKVENLSLLRKCYEGNSRKVEIQEVAL